LDKRTVVALGIIALIFIMLPYYWEMVGFSPKEAPQNLPADSLGAVADTARRPGETAAPVGTSPTDGGGSESGSAGDLATLPGSVETARLDTLPEEFYEIETDLYTAEISSHGGSISSFVLKKFHYFQGEQIELIPDRNAYPLRFEFPEAGGLATSALSFVGPDRNLDLTNAARDSGDIALEARTPDGIPVRLIYTFRRGTYTVGLRLEAPRDGELARVTKLSLLWKGGLDPTEANAKDDYGYFSAYARQAGEVAKFQKFKDGRLHEGSSGDVTWVGTKTKYFVVTMRSADGPAEDFDISATENEQLVNDVKVNKRVFDLSLGRRVTGNVDSRFELYLGPVDYSILSSVGYDMERTVEMGFWLFRPFAVAILWFITTVHHILPNYGWVIILFTVTMKAILFPFSRKNYAQMAKMKALQPKLKALQEKHKDDPQRLNQQMMKFYKEEKFNPLGGCIWMLPQLPIFWALFTVFKSAIELRGAGFLWLVDLSQPSLALAIIMSVAMLGQQMITNKDPKQKFMVYGFPLIMFFLFKGFPAGLVLYWTVYNVLSIVEQKWVEHTLARDAAPA
jgi:YidC/Oxa1 family membrane protein insertase